MTKRDRERLVARVKRLHPESYLRVRNVCVFSAFGFDLDYHAASIVQAGTGKAAAAK